ncbi:collagen alpha-1(X) chain-like [Saccostrea echinata]|uniref:collagen alpha-1(X) chain-like n=1 Tax=Saccostrea echinata TaxID=191078 RepID=UPI002A839B98|nr:collagen alpha-1(X) chain-like [Saccostrea echinata]
MSIYYVAFFLILFMSFSEDSACCATYKRPVVAFTAKLSKDATVSGRQVVKYDKVLTNWGGAYNPKTGIFIAPYDGLYTISGTLMSHPTNYVHLEIVKNGIKMSILFSHSKTYPQSGQTLHILLNKGDRVWIQNHNKETAKLRDHGSYNLFSGLLITEF